MTSSAGLSALSHLRVLDLTRARAGPTCCRILADFGVDVLKVDAPLRELDYGDADIQRLRDANIV